MLLRQHKHTHTSSDMDVNKFMYVEFSFHPSFSLSRLLFVKENCCLKPLVRSEVEDFAYKEGIMAKMRIDGQNFSEIRWKFLDFFYLIIPSNDQMRITFKMKMKILIAINDEEEEEKMKWKMLIELQSSAQLECFNSIYVNWMQIKRESERVRCRRISPFLIFFYFFKSMNYWSEWRERKKCKNFQSMRDEKSENFFKILFCLIFNEILYW